MILLRRFLSLLLELVKLVMPQPIAGAMGYFRALLRSDSPGFPNDEAA
jgi:hypothetical protein